MTRVWATNEMEDALRARGVHIVAGADEVGRGALAGPLVVACVVVNEHFDCQVCDSKQLNRTQRKALQTQITTVAIDWSLAFVDADIIDDFGLSAALRSGYIQALEGLEVSISRLLLDGNVDYLADFAMATAIIRGDVQHASISAASILAKVARDEYMIEAARAYPEYGFATHVGYGTVAHRAALAHYGLTPLHRKSFQLLS